jgi:Kinase binding protein CGI-121
MESTVTFEAFPNTNLTLLFFKDLENASDIRDKIVSKSLSFDAAFIDADVLPGVFLTHLAAFKALAAQVRPL